MQLIDFRVTNYRSVSDSGPIEVRRITTLVGRNESGKTNLLAALEALNPASGRQELTWVKDFPRDRPRSEFNENLVVVSTSWQLTPEEQAELATVFPRSVGVEKVTVDRRYHTRLTVGFAALPPLALNRTLVETEMKSLSASIQGSAIRASTAGEPVLAALAKAQELATTSSGTHRQVASALNDGLDVLESSASSSGVNLTEKALTSLAAIREAIRVVLDDEVAHQNGRNWVAAHLPPIIYIAEYPELEGHQHLKEFLDREARGELTAPDENFVKLMKVAELDPDELHSLLASDHEERQQLTNRAGAYVSRTIRRLWTDRQLTVRFNLDAEHFDTLISDPNAVYPTEINLNERSRGFKWFFSFYITFAADTSGGPAEDALLLFDEPGLYLHATAQGDLLRQFASDFQNQIIFTTHSPFMIPVDRLDTVRTVNIDQEHGTTVTNDPSGDSKTLFPLQAALGFEIAQTLFVGPANLLVEGVTDYWYLSSIDAHLRDSGRPGLRRDVAITPAGGASKVTYLVSLLGGQNLNVVVLFDDEPDARRQGLEIARAKLIRDDDIVFTSAGFETAPATGSDIEDLIDPAAFEALVRESYSEELRGKSLNLNLSIPRIVLRFEQAFQEVGLEFAKTRPAKLFLRKIADEPESVLTETSLAQFERLISVINLRFESMDHRGTRAFR